MSVASSSSSASDIIGNISAAGWTFMRSRHLVIWLLLAPSALAPILPIAVAPQPERYGAIPHLQALGGYFQRTCSCPLGLEALWDERTQHSKGRSPHHRGPWFRLLLLAYRRNQE